MDFFRSCTLPSIVEMAVLSSCWEASILALKIEIFLSSASSLDLFSRLNLSKESFCLVVFFYKLSSLALSSLLARFNDSI